MKFNIVMIIGISIIVIPFIILTIRFSFIVVIEVFKFLIEEVIKPYIKDIKTLINFRRLKKSNQLSKEDEYEYHNLSVKVVTNYIYASLIVGFILIILGMLVSIFLI